MSSLLKVKEVFRQQQSLLVDKFMHAKESILIILAKTNANINNNNNYKNNIVFKLKPQAIVQKANTVLFHGIPVKLNSITGYDECIRFRRQVIQADGAFKEAQQNYQVVKQDYEQSVIDHSKLQKEIAR